MFFLPNVRQSRNEVHIFGDGLEYLKLTLFFSHASRTPSVLSNTPVAPCRIARTRLPKRPSLTDYITVEVEPAQQDRIIGEHHQYQPQLRITWLMNGGKDHTSRRVEQIVEQSLPEGDPFTKVHQLRSRYRHRCLLVLPEGI